MECVNVLVDNSLLQKYESAYAAEKAKWDKDHPEEAKAKKVRDSQAVAWTCCWILPWHKSLVKLQCTHIDTHCRARRPRRSKQPCLLVTAVQL
jgi:hypothetical protein